MKIHEKRRNQRVPYQASVDIILEKQTIEHCTSHNLSQNGIFVETDASLTVGDSCQLTISLSGTESITLHIQGFVSRVTSRGAGICFTNMELDSANHLHQIVYYNQSDSK